MINPENKKKIEKFILVWLWFSHIKQKRFPEKILMKGFSYISAGYYTKMLTLGSPFHFKKNANLRKKNVSILLLNIMVMN